MSSELPPTEYFSGINFNPDFYSSGSDNITTEEAKNLIIAYTSSGSDTITTLTTSTINTLGSTLSIGTNGTTSDTVIIGTNSNTQTSIYGGIIGLLSNTTITGILTNTGLISANGGLSLSGDNCITLGNPTTAPTSTQLGYTLYSNNNTAFTVNTTLKNLATLTNIGIGVYQITCNCTLYTWSIGATQVVNITQSSSGGVSASIPKTVINGIATTFQTTPTLGGIVRFTSAINTLTFDIQITAGGGTCICSNFGYYAVRIA